MASPARDIMEELECDICFQYITPPTRLCVKGHVLCSSCQDGDPAKCILCNDHLVRSSNEGKKPRRLNCPFNIVLKMCEWQGYVAEMKAHIESQHTNVGDVFVAPGRFTTDNPNMRQIAHWYQAVFTLDEVFFSYSYTTLDTLYAVVLYVGDCYKSKNFKYELAYRSADGSDRITRTYDTPCYKDVHDVIRNKACVVLSYDFVERCVDAENKLPYTIEICRK